MREGEGEILSRGDEVVVRREGERGEMMGGESRLGREKEILVSVGGGRPLKRLIRIMMTMSVMKRVLVINSYLAIGDLLSLVSNNQVHLKESPIKRAVARGLHQQVRYLADSYKVNFFGNN